MSQLEQKSHRAAVATRDGQGIAKSTCCRREKRVVIDRRVCRQNGGALGNENAIKWMFERRGTLTLNVLDSRLDEMMEVFYSLFSFFSKLF